MALESGVTDYMAYGFTYLGFLTTVRDLAYEIQISLHG
jgi:hypothetical protein